MLTGCQLGKLTEKQLQMEGSNNALNFYELQTIFAMTALIRTKSEKSVHVHSSPRLNWIKCALNLLHDSKEQQCHIGRSHILFITQI